VTLSLAVGTNPAAQTVNPCDTPNKLPATFFEVPAGPQGTWTAFVAPDPRQPDDPEVPVLVAGAGAIQGPANRRGMRLGCGTLKNRSPKSVVSLQLRWILVRTQDRPVIAQQGYTTETVLAEGHTTPMELSIAKDGFRQTDFSLISFAAATQTLLKDGILTGDYALIVGVHQVLFEDGTMWQSTSILK